MVSLENIISCKAFNHKPNMEILSGLARGILIAGVIYLALKLIKLFKGGIGDAFDGSMEANMFLLEMIVGVIVPVVLLLMKNIRENINSIMFVNIMVVAGILINRLNVAIFGVYKSQSATGFSYFPTWMEFVVTLAFISMAVLGFQTGS